MSCFQRKCDVEPPWREVSPQWNTRTSPAQRQSRRAWPRDAPRGRWARTPQKRSRRQSLSSGCLAASLAQARARSLRILQGYHRDRPPLLEAAWPPHKCDSRDSRDTDRRVPSTTSTEPEQRAEALASRQVPPARRAYLQVPSRKRPPVRLRETRTLLPWPPSQNSALD